MASFREASLHEALTVLRRTRRRRKLLRGIGMASLPALLVFLVVLGRLNSTSRHNAATAVTPVAAAAPEPARPPAIEYISDEELLALFPDQPLALVGRDGRQQLVFLGQALPN